MRKIVADVMNGTPRYVVPTTLRTLGRGLPDELGLMVCPVVVGTGGRLLEEGDEQLGLKLVDATTFGTGVLSLTYSPAAG